MRIEQWESMLDELLGEFEDAAFQAGNHRSDDGDYGPLSVALHTRKQAVHAHVRKLTGMFAAGIATPIERAVVRAGLATRIGAVLHAGRSRHDTPPVQDEVIDLAFQLRENIPD